MFTFFSTFKNKVVAQLDEIKAAFQRIEQKLDAMFGVTAKPVAPAAPAAPETVVVPPVVADAATAVAQEQATPPVA